MEMVPSLPTPNCRSGEGVRGVIEVVVVMVVAGGEDRICVMSALNEAMGRS